MIWIIIFIILMVFALWYLLFKVKRIKLDCVTLVTGGVKTGKSTLSFGLARREYKKSHRKWWFKRYVLMQRSLEEPLFYSNIPTTCEYVPLTKEMIERKVRINEKSVVYIDEMSLLADSMSFKDDELNERMSLWIKLFGHECGGKMFINTQAIGDNHYAVKRSISKHLYVYHCTKWIPFILIFSVREMFYSDDGNMINVAQADIEETMKKYVMSKRIWKKFDYRAYSVFTDGLDNECEILPPDKKRDLKCDNFVSFKKYKTIPMNQRKEVHEIEVKKDDKRKLAL